MTLLLNRQLFLWIAALAFGLALFFVVVVERNADPITTVRYIESVEKHVRRELETGEQDLQRLASAKPSGFAAFQNGTAHPSFIFRNDSLIAWSDHRIVPDNSVLRLRSFPAFVRLPHGGFIANRVVRTRLGDTLTTASLLPIYRLPPGEPSSSVQYNRSLFPVDPISVSLKPLAGYESILSADGRFLFGFQPPVLRTLLPPLPLRTTVLLVIGLFFGGIYCLLHALKRHWMEHPGRSLAWLTAAMLLLRSGLSYAGTLFLIPETNLFTSASGLPPGDLLLNALFLLPLPVYAARTYTRSFAYHQILRQSAWSKALISTGLVLAGYGVFYYFLFVLNGIGNCTPLTIDRVLMGRFSLAKLVCLLTYLSAASLYFLTVHLMAHLFIRLNVHRVQGVVRIAFATAVAALTVLALQGTASSELPGGAFLVHMLYFLLLYTLRLPYTLHSSRQQTLLLYLSAGALVCAVFGGKQLADSAFLFLIGTGFVLLVLLVRLLMLRLLGRSLTYALQLQLLLNSAVFFPSVLISAGLLLGIRSVYDDRQQALAGQMARTIAVNVQPYQEAYLAGRVNLAYLTDVLRRSAPPDGHGLAVYANRGLLETAAHSVSPPAAAAPPYVNPQAFTRITQQEGQPVILDERSGSRSHRVTYILLRSSEGRRIGILRLSFRSSPHVTNPSYMQIVSTVLSVVAALFLVFLLVSHLASTAMTRPLRFLTRRLRKTGLDQLNEPLSWKTDDEMGQLAGEYNRMLTKLEERKQAFSQSEKQAAWEEMANQVAHEIKNPLTPMKLSLQQLQRTMSADTPAAKRMMQRTINSLLVQIDDLSDIAASFADFAKMPLPKNEVFEITNVLNRAADRYADDQKITLERDIVDHPVQVIGDRQLIGRIVTNLIINGIQSVPPGRKPLIRLRLSVNRGTVNLEVSDNGTGIPEAIRNKVFLPHFSTKRGGAGLGLAIAKRGVEHAGGTIWFETEEDVGTTFYISLIQANGVVVPGRDRMVRA